MCGIAGEIVFDSAALADFSGRLKSMADAMVKRGPDAEGYWQNHVVGLAHRRLSILDLETGAQPMVQGDCVVAFNGEIYNFEVLKAELVSAGQVFATQSDTEVLLVGYQVWGWEELLEKLEGMFAFALYDIKQGKVRIARDRFGEKPLFYSHTATGLAFASEIKALQALGLGKGISDVGLRLFMQLSYIPAPHSIYQDIHKLEAGCYLEIAVDAVEEKAAAEVAASKTAEDATKIIRYYDLREEVNFKKARLDEVLGVMDEGQQQAYLQTEIKRLLKRSISQKMLSDVPLGAFLSGGVDSSIVSAVMQEILEERKSAAENSDSPVSKRIQATDKLKTFSMGMNDYKYDESERAHVVVAHLQSEHFTEKLDYDGVLPHLDEWIGYFDEPFGDSSCLPTSAVAAMARKQVTVVLTGDCADELFGGYEKYLMGHYKQQWNRVPHAIQNIVAKLVGLLPTTPRWNPYVRKFKKVHNLSHYSDEALAYRLMCMGFLPEEVKKLVNNNQQGSAELDMLQWGIQWGKSWGNRSFLDESMIQDTQVVLEGDMLVKVDRMCMLQSLEARVPFLERELVELALAMDAKWKIQGKERKWILRETYRDMLPSETFDNSKKGFGVPVDFWFRGALKTDLQRTLDPKKLKEQGLFQVEYVQQLLQEHLSEKANHKGKLWNLYVFQKWYEKQFNA